MTKLSCLKTLFVSLFMTLHSVVLPGFCPSVNFINVLRTNFLYERHFSSYVLALKELSYVKFARLTLMKLTACLHSQSFSQSKQSIQLSLTKQLD